ncbi:MAG: HPP family protein [Bacteroidia bacterium]
MTTDHEWLSTQSKAKQAEHLTFEHDVFHLPVSQKGTFIGILSFAQLTALDIENDVEIKSFLDEFEKVAVNENRFVFDIVHLFSEHHLTAIPVIDDDEKLKGILKATDVLNYLGKTLSIANPGSFITIKLEPNGYNLQEISRIVESNNAQIISLHFEPQLTETELLCTIKINQKDLSHIIATFERFDYELVAHSSTSENDDVLHQRYDQLMKYLNI